MSIFDRLFPPRTMQKINPEQIKEKGLSTFGGSIFGFGGKKASFFDLTDHEVITNGYNTNPFVYAVVNRLAFLMAIIPLKVGKITDSQKYHKYKSMDFGKKINHYHLKEHSIEDTPDHPLQELLDNPNEEQGRFEFWQSFFINKLSTGNGYIEGLQPTDTRPPIELWNLPPLSVTLNESGNFYNKVIEAYFNWGTTAKTIPVDKLMHSKYYNPTGSVYGLSPLSAARKAVQQINDGDEWNAALLQNGAKPEYMIIVAPGTPPEEKEKLKKRFKEDYSGPYNPAKEPIVTDEDFMKIEQLGYTMKDMDWQKSQLNNMRKVYDVYGVGSEIFNDPENKIQSNKKEAIRSLYTDRILPETENRTDELRRWLLPKFGEENLVIEEDLEAVDALNEELNSIVERIAQIDYWTENEKREATGKEAIDEDWANQVWKPANKIPVTSIQDMQLFELEHTYTGKGLENISLNGN